MGGDGGQVIDRATMVKTKGWGLTKGSGDRFAASLGEMSNYMQMTFEDRGLGTLEKHRTRMTQCFLSQQALTDPVVACRLGNLYNKEAVIGAILNRNLPAGLAHIKKLSDLKNCIINWKEAKEHTVRNGNEAEDSKRHMVCPMSLDDLDSGCSRAVVIWPTGAVVGLKMLKELKAKECPVTGKPFDFEKDVMRLAPDDDELAKLVERLPEDRKKKRKAMTEASEQLKQVAEGRSVKTKNDATEEAAAASSSSKPNDASFHTRVDSSGKMKKDFVPHEDELCEGGTKKALAVGDKVSWTGYHSQVGLGNVIDLDLLRSDGRTVRIRFPEACCKEVWLTPAELVKVKGPAANNLKSSEKGSELWKSMFCTDREGLSGPRDGFGKPYFNRGSAIGV